MPTSPHAVPLSIDELDAENLRSPAVAGTVFLFDRGAIASASRRIFYESSLTQWLLTWSKHQGQISFPAATSSLIDDLTEAAALLPGKILGLLPPGTLPAFSAPQLAQFRTRLLTAQTRWPDLAVTDSASLVCVDRLARTKGLPSQLYTRDRSAVASWESFRTVLDDLIEFVVQDQNVRGAIQERRDQLTSVLWELFKNTHDHGRRNVDAMVPLDTSVRGIFFRFYDAQHIKDQLSKLKPEAQSQAERYAAFLLRETPLHEGVRERRTRNVSGFLELTVFDSGPGLAATWLRDESIAERSIADQIAAVHSCFGKGYSSLDQEERGFGLWKVLRELRKLKGLIRVRTNRVHIYREFARLPSYRLTMVHGIERPVDRLFDWQKGLTESADTRYPNIEGALVSVLVPLGDNL